MDFEKFKQELLDDWKPVLNSPNLTDNEKAYIKTLARFISSALKKYHDEKDN